MFKRASFRIVDVIPEGVLNWVRGWDLAATSKKKNPRAAFTAGCKMGMCANGTIIIADMQREQFDPGQVKELVQRTAKADGAHVRVDLPQDPGQAGVAQVQDFVKDMQGFMVFGSPESGDKAQRAIPLSAQASVGNVCLLRGPWNEAFMAEAELFPASTYKDQIDASSRAYAALLSLGGSDVSRIAPTLFIL